MEQNWCLKVAFFSEISTLGITEFGPHPEGSENNEISVETFMQQA